MSLALKRRMKAHSHTLNRMILVIGSSTYTIFAIAKKSTGKAMENLTHHFNALVGRCPKGDWLNMSPTTSKIGKYLHIS